LWERLRGGHKEGFWGGGGIDAGEDEERERERERDFVVERTTWEMHGRPVG
jgi:hypothetical protein